MSTETRLSPNQTILSGTPPYACSVACRRYSKLRSGTIESREVHNGWFRALERRLFDRVSHFRWRQMLEATTWLVNAVPAFLNALLALTFFVFLPLAMFKRTQQFAADGFLLVAYCSAPLLITASAIVVFLSWGLIAVIIGILWMGVGIVAMALAAVIADGTPAELAALLEYIALPLTAAGVSMRLRPEP